MEENKIIIHQTEDGQTLIDVRLENETVWLNVELMSLLFNREESNVRRHIINVFKEGELERENNVHFLHVNGVKKPVPFYNLDVIISVGYRVKSKRGTAFRIWARNVIKDYLVKGYAVNERIRKEQIGELRQLVSMLGRTIQSQPLLSTDESNALFEVVTDYTYALDTLDNYDYERLTIEKTTKEEPFHATYENAMEEINRLRDKFGGSVLFGNEKDDSFKSSIGQICQTFADPSATFFEHPFSLAALSATNFLSSFALADLSASQLSPPFPFAGASASHFFRPFALADPSARGFVG